jgi:cytochrome c peroxidase
MGRRIGILRVAGCAALLAACDARSRGPGDALAADEPPAPAASAPADPIAPIPLHADLDARKVALGARLFDDPIMSRDGAVACRTCHLRELTLADGRSRSQAPGRPESAFNAPTLYNVAYNDKLNWNGKFSTLEDHVGGAMQNASAMDTPWPEAVRRLEGVPAYRAAFGALYPRGITAESAADAIAEYERSLRTPGSRYDRWLRGDHAALTDAELEGWALFRSYGCVSCHQGMNVGGNLLERFGVFGEYLQPRGGAADPSLGRFLVTGREEDRFVFRVPSLRNVALTAPYFHDGSAATLEIAIEVMGRVQLGRRLPSEHVERIAAFLETLTGEPADEPPR